MGSYFYMQNVAFRSVPRAQHTLCHALATRLPPPPPRPRTYPPSAPFFSSLCRWYQSTTCRRSKKPTQLLISPVLCCDKGCVRGRRNGPQLRFCHSPSPLNWSPLLSRPIRLRQLLPVTQVCGAAAHTEPLYLCGDSARATARSTLSSSDQRAARERRMASGRSVS